MHQLHLIDCLGEPGGGRWHPYAVSPAWQRPVAVAAVLMLAAVDYRGMTRTARLTRVIVAVLLLTLAVVVAAGLLCGEASPAT
jgi:basic amino acid/polyamine antiporter, APA family